MAMPRTPKAKAAVSGQAGKNPQRFKGRKDPTAASLGNPPAWMTKEQCAVWSQFAHELPWLNGSHRALLEIAVNVRTRLIAGQDVGVQALNLLRQCLGQMGATPADATKITVPDGDEEDPDEAFFRRPN
ncbi:hypothetical protein [Azospirillum sp.]|uniref:hypothetical protein n=1 Tax=Azospirillum sp. TaxID=34012 RepID=UPI003D703603